MLKIATANEKSSCTGRYQVIEAVEVALALPVSRLALAPDPISADKRSS